MTKRKRSSSLDFRRFSNVADFAQVMLNYHFKDAQRHFDHVKHITKLLCLQYNDMHRAHPLPEHDLMLIFAGAALHDIGLISIPDSMLNHKGPLTPEQRKLYEEHARTGAAIIDQMAGIYRLSRHEKEILRNICLYHHERYDGGGYPEGLKGDEIPLYAQIVSIAEVYDSLTADNYSEPRSHEEAMNLIRRGECGAFNPMLLECMERASCDMQALLECATNDERITLLQNTYSINRRSYWIQKRILDVTVSALALVVLSPLLLLIALAVFIDDPHGSPIFCQTRVGRHKKLFTIYKFRTMHVDAEERRAELETLNEKDGPVFKIANDPRITRLGGFLRRTSLDELPQLFNVLKGDMTLVGPRPPLPSEVAQYSRYAEMRLSVTPGLTCIWQVQPHRDDIRFDQWVDMDIAYIGTRSMRHDLKLLFQTVMAVLRRSGS
ncbi:MAG: sugar transferase [Clostridia bacterium]|nr:sugar transferase [Clostridia bacterium]